MCPADPERAQKLNARLGEYFEREFDWYPGVREILENWKKSGIPLVVITAGAFEFQSTKLKRLGFEFDTTYITNIAQKDGKASAISLLLREYPDRPLFYVDDKASELAHIAEDDSVDASRVRLFQISYGDGPERDAVVTEKQFQKISSLREIYG